MKMKNKIKDYFSEKGFAIGSSIIEFSIMESVDYVKNFCNIRTVPEEAEFTLMQIAIDLIDYDNVDNNEVKSINQGDTSITFNLKYKQREDIFKAYNKKLSKFRRTKK